MKLRRKPSFDEWESAGDTVRVILEAGPWWAVDWLNYGEGMFGEEAAQAIDAMKWSDETMRIYRYIGQRVAPENRFPPQEVPFTTHYVVARLPPAEQRHWLKRTAKERWTREQLRYEIIRAQTHAGETLHVWVLIDAKDPEDAQKLLDRLSLEGRNGKIVSRMQSLKTQ